MTFFFTHCNSTDEITSNSRLGKPDQESWGVTILLTDEGLIKAKIRSGHLEKYKEREFILLDSSVTVDFFDERYSSDIIFKELRKSDFSTTKIKKKLDQQSAAYILQGYLDRSRNIL
mgnify:CR=1 FL=1